MKEVFRKIAGRVSALAGSPWMFLLAFLLVFVWALSGPLFDFSSTWQLVINTATTIATFLMVFLIQNTQNRDAKAMQLKLDELIRASRPARDNFVDIEDISDDELAELDEEFKRMHKVYEKHPESLHKLHHKIKTAHAHRLLRK